jgi:hypothetical protein
LLGSDGDCTYVNGFTVWERGLYVVGGRDEGKGGASDSCGCDMQWVRSCTGWVGCRGVVNSGTWEWSGACFVATLRYPVL